MGAETMSQYIKRVRVAFIIVALFLPIQLYVVLTQGNMYPCVHLPGFQPVLDTETNLYYTDRNLYAITSNSERIPVKYTELFDVLPEYFARHTMNHLFVAAENSNTIELDLATKKWIRERLKTITGKNNIDFLEVETMGYHYSKKKPIKPDISLQYTLFLPLYE